MLKDKDWNLLLPPYKDMGTSKTRCWGEQCYTHTTNEFRYTTGMIRIRDIYTGSPSLNYRINMDPYQEIQSKSIIIGSNDKNNIRFGYIDWGYYKLTDQNSSPSIAHILNMI